LVPIACGGSEKDAKARPLPEKQQTLSPGLYRSEEVAVILEEMPISEVARRMGTNQNALYKLLHDARKKLKRQMEAAGLSANEVLAVFDEG
jgi:DNA-directed RNA polymerase specialized sigma24 family protein